MSDLSESLGLLPVMCSIETGGFRANVMEDGSLRSITWMGKVLLRSIYAAVRDHNWGNVPIRISNVQSGQLDHMCRISFTAEHRKDHIHYRWIGTIEMTDTGMLTYDFEGEALSDFHKNRIGFCLLHPLEMAGCRVEVETPDGIRSDKFPEMIVPFDPFVDIRSFRIVQPEQFDFSIRFEGDLFQTEDQRNWTDGSYKTFCTPLRLPYPVQVSKGDRVRQKIILQIHSGPKSSAERMSDKAIIAIGAESVGKLPKLGTTWFPENGELTPIMTELHQSASWHDIRVVLSLEEGNWPTRLTQASEAARVLETTLHVELLVPYSLQELESCIKKLSLCSELLGSISIYPIRLEGAPEKVNTVCELSGASLRATQYVTTLYLLQELRRLLDIHGLKVKIGGGSRGNFAEWNRAELPLELMDYTEFAVNPQVHTTDLLSVLETLPSQELAVRTARHRIGNLPLHISSVMLKPEFNPYGADDEAVIGSSFKEGRKDQRMTTSLAGGWTIGSIYQLARSGASLIRYYEHVGALGMMTADAEKVHPVFRLFKELSEMRDADLLPVQMDPLQVSVLALRKDDRMKLLIANLKPEYINVSVNGSVLQGSLRTLASRVLGDSVSYPTEFIDGCFELNLAPCSIVVVDTI